jgi:hypothetical protein
MEAAVRKIIESTLVSADGVIGDPPRWAMEYRDAEVTAEALERLASADAMLMGRAPTSSSRPYGRTSPVSSPTG